MPLFDCLFVFIQRIQCHNKLIDIIKHTLNGNAVAVLLNATISIDTLQINKIDTKQNHIFFGMGMNDSVCGCFGDVGDVGEGNR